jgi:hypothetical protein
VIECSRNILTSETIFQEAPAVVLGITELESTFDPVRVAVEAKNVTPRGSDAEIRTWSDTHILSCSGYWLASTS